MPLLTISEVARRMRLNTSAIRYYEQLGILPPASRIGRQRRYDRSVLYQLAVVQRARLAGFTLEEVRTLFVGFEPGTRAETRWRKLADSKLAELAEAAEQIKGMQDVLRRMREKCHCQTLDACGKGIFESGVAKVAKTKVSPWRKIRTAEWRSTRELR